MHIQPTVQRQIEHMQTNEVGYNQPTVQRQIEQTINKAIKFNQAASLAYKHPNNQQQTIQNIPNSNQVAPVVNQPRSYNRPIGYEEKSYLCIWCETPTKFNDYKKLNKHIERFHAAFMQKNKGLKRANDSLDEISSKRVRGKGIKILDKDGYDADDEDDDDTETDTETDTWTDVESETDVDEDNKISPNRLRWNVTGIPGDDKYIDDTDEDEETDEETDVEDEDDSDEDEETDEETDVEDEDEEN